MLTVKNASRRLQVSPSLIYSLCAKGLIAHFRCGIGRGAIRISEKALQEYLDRSQVTERVFMQSRENKFRQLDAERLAEAWNRRGISSPVPQPDLSAHAGRQGVHKPC